MKKPSTVLHNPSLRRLRALKMIEMRVMNNTDGEIARAFNVHVNTVRRTLSWAERAGVIADFEDKILQELIPAAHKAVLKGMNQEDNPIEAAKIGLEIFKGAVPGFGKAKTGPKGNYVDPDDDLSAHIALLRAQSGVLDGEIGPHPELPPAPAAPEGIEEGPDLPPGRPGVHNGSAESGETEVGPVGNPNGPEGVE
jgi:hypothetical protein